MKKGRNWVWIMGIVSVLLLLEASLIHGAELRDLLSKFRPYITVRETYTNNLNLTPKNKEHDFITSVSGGLNFSTTDETYGIDLSLPMGYVFYAKHHNDNFFSIGPAGLNSWVTLAKGLTFRVRDYLVRSDEAREQQYSANAPQYQYLLSTARGKPSIFIRNVVEPSVEYQFGNENLFSVLYRNNTYNHQSPLYDDSMENTINPRLVYWFDIHNGVSLDYYFTYNSYQRSPDQFINGVTPRYTYRFNPRALIFGEFHFEYQDFESPGVNYNVYNPSLGIQYQFSPTLSGTAQVGYFWEIPVQGGKTQGPSFNLSLTKNTEKTKYTLSFQGGYTEDYITAQNLGFTKTYMGYGTIKHQLTQRMSVGLTGSLERDEYSSGQKDWVWGIWGNASYLILKWLTVSLEASHREDHSTINIFDYSEYRGTFKITATF